MLIKDISTIKNSGEVDVVFPKNYNELKELYLNFLNNNIKFKVIGCGSNSLISDKYDGTLICLNKMDYAYLLNPTDIYVSAFYPTNKFVCDMAELGYDYSMFVGIPGLLGGLIYNNGGSFSKSISDYVIYVNYLNSNGDIIRMDKDKLMFDYRHSIFKEIDGVIVGVGLKYSEGENIIDSINSNLKVRNNKLPKLPSLGSIFKNVEEISAWKIIDQIGLRDYHIGGASFSKKHCNVIVNNGEASFEDIYKLIKMAKELTFASLNINLEEEITIIK